MTDSRIVKTELLLTAARFDVQRVSYQTTPQSTVTKEIIKHPGAVVILPVLSDGSIVLIENYRVAIDRVLLELPAGTCDRAEPRIETARRELAEETGYRCEKIHQLCEFHMSPGILDERMTAFVATQLIEGQQELEEGELIKCHPLTISEVDQSIRDGQIQDAKTIAALLYYLRYSP